MPNVDVDWEKIYELRSDMGYAQQLFSEDSGVTQAQVIISELQSISLYWQDKQDKKLDQILANQGQILEQIREIHNETKQDQILTQLKVNHDRIIFNEQQIYELSTRQDQILTKIAVNHDRIIFNEGQIHELSTRQDQILGQIQEIKYKQDGIGEAMNSTDQTRSSQLADIKSVLDTVLENQQKI
jgi:hypothetical protein